MYNAEDPIAEKKPKKSKAKSRKNRTNQATGLQTDNHSNHLIYTADGPVSS